MRAISDFGMWILDVFAEIQNPKSEIICSNHRNVDILPTDHFVQAESWTKRSAFQLFTLTGRKDH
jgi:hypothetical protein